MDELRKQLESDGIVVGDRLGKAKELWENGQRDKAFNILVRLTEDSSRNRGEQLTLLTTLQGHVYQAGEHADLQDDRIKRLEEQVQYLREARRQEEIQQSRQRARLEISEQKKLLGQAAYEFSGLVEKFVFGEAGTGLARHLSLSEIAAMAHRPTTADPPYCAEPGMTEAQRDRWKSVSAMMATLQLPRNFLDADKVLRRLRYHPAHGDPDQLAQTSIENLLSWTGMIESVSVSAVRKYVHLLSKFSSCNSPLAPNLRPEEVFLS